MEYNTSCVVPLQLNFRSDNANKLAEFYTISSEEDKKRHTSTRLL